jgi:DUF4097 and DUF4098 domain-containing protein YvlB
MSNTIKDIKIFIIEQMRNGQFASFSNKEGYEKYESDYIVIEKEKTEVTIQIKKSDLKLSLDDIDLSYLRFKILMLSVQRSANNFKERAKKEMIKRRWDKFLNDNKELKRDRKLNDILK